MSARLIVMFDVESDKVDSFHAMMKALARDLPKKPECLSAQVFQGEDKPESFYLFEEWTSRTAHQQHIEELKLAGSMQHVRSFLVADPVTCYLRLVGADTGQPE